MIYPSGQTGGIQRIWVVLYGHRKGMLRKKRDAGREGKSARHSNTGDCREDGAAGFKRRV